MRSLCTVPPVERRSYLKGISMENKPKLLLACIFKDDSEYELIERMLNSFDPYISGLVAVITGVSGDNQRIKALIKRHNGTYSETTPSTNPTIYGQDEKGNFFANFAAARNLAFDLASEKQKTENYDYWLWSDADDVLVNGQELLAAAQKAKEIKADAVFFTYWYAVTTNPDGSVKDVLIDHLRERLLKPDVFKWVSRLHEVAVPKDDAYKPNNTLYDFNPKEGRNCVWVHLADEGRMSQNLLRNTKILEMQIEEEQRKDPRTIFYLAKTYYDMHQTKYDDLAEGLIHEYLKLSGWAEERSNAWEYIGNIRSHRGDHRGAVEAYFEAAKQYGNRHMIYLLIAKEYSELQLWEDSNFWLNTALRMDEPRTRTTIGNPLEIKLLAASLKYNEAMRSQKLDDAIYWLEIRNKLTGEEDQGMLAVLKDAKLMNEAAMWAFNYSKWLKDTGHKDKVRKVLESLPLELGREPFAHMIANDFSEPKVWAENEIAYFANFGGEHFEQWSGKSLTRGIGGSETAVIELSRRWAKMGYKVTVYGDPRAEEGDIDGVTYKPYYTFNWKDDFNILIFWRTPHFLDRDFKAKKILVDLHDICSQLDWTEPRMAKVDHVMFKSQAHRKMLPKLPEEKAVVISNGI
jgi:tetratricopeptide (TPR) repeat protein